MAEVIFNHLEHVTGCGRETSRPRALYSDAFQALTNSLIQQLGAGNCLVCLKILDSGCIVSGARIHYRSNE